MKKIFTIAILVLLSINTFAQNQWVQIATLPVSNLNINFLDSLNGYLSGYNGELYKTMDGGYTWTMHNTGLTGVVVKFANETTGYAYSSGTTGLLYKTTDGGNTWTTLNSGITGEYISVDFMGLNNPDKFVIYRSGSTFKITNDGGYTWTMVDVGNHASIGGINFIDQNVGFLSAIDNDIIANRDTLMVFKTTDGGINWSLIYVKSRTELNYGYIAPMTDATLQFINASVGYLQLGIALSYTGVTLKTTDGGLSWTIISGGAGYLFFCDENYGWLLKYWSGIKRSTNGGITFTDSYLSSSITNAAFLKGDRTRGWATLQNKVLKYQPIAFNNISFFNNVTAPSNNPNNIIGAGKKVRFKTEITNNIGSNLLTLSGVISTSNPYVTITNAIGVYNNVANGSSGWNANEYEIQIDPNIPNNEEVTFNLSLSDQIVTDGPWYTSFTIPIVLNPFDVSNNIIDDDNIPDSNGDNDDVAEAGETIEIIPLMDNTTTHSFSNIEGYLYSPFPEIDIWNNVVGSTETVYNHYTYGTLNLGATNIPPAKDFVFTNSFASTYSLPFDMIMTGNISSFNGSNKYQNIEFRWAASFVMNNGYPNNPNGINETLNENFITLFPNPSKNTVTIYSEKEDLISIEIIDIIGQSIFYKKCNSLKDVVDISYYNDGVYLLKIKTESNITFKKLLKN